MTSLRAALVRSFAAALLVTLVAPAAARAGAWIASPGEQYGTIEGSRFSSDDFHDLEGNRRAIALGGLVEERDARWTGEVGWKKRMSIFLDVPFSSVTRRTADAFGPVQGTETGLGDLLAGVRYRLGAASGPQALSLEAAWKAPLGYSRRVLLGASEIAALDATLFKDFSPGDSANAMRQASPPRLGDGEQAFQGVLWYGASLPAVHAFLEVGAGYRTYLEHVGDQMLGRANLGVWLGPSLLVVGRYDGEIGVSDGDTPADKVTRHLAGAELLYRVDDGLDVFAGSMHSASAKNALHTDRFYAGMAFRHTKLNRLQGFLGGKQNP